MLALFPLPEFFRQFPQINLSPLLASVCTWTCQVIAVPVACFVFCGLISDPPNTAASKHSSGYEVEAPLLVGFNWQKL
eukprot:4371012-Amphidinium_carterae.2